MSGLHVDVEAAFTAEGAETFHIDTAITVESGETLVVLGPSGSGKTLLLETIAGFHHHTGEIALNGQPLNEIPPEHRGFGFVFQDFALFPHLSVRRNVAYGTRYHEDTRDPDSLLAELGIGDLADRYPPSLSGGEKQRVALARALAIRPAVLLLDEPLAALDVPTRQELRNDLADVLEDVTTLYVTHDRTTARALADQIVVMANGRIQQRGSPTEVFDHPTSPMVAEFTGANVIDPSASASLRDLFDRAGIDHRVAIRPEAVPIRRDKGDISATVKRIVPEDAGDRVTLSFDEVTLEAFSDDPLSVGDEVWISLPHEALSPLN